MAPMSPEIQTGPEPNKVDSAASDACTRSGLFALVLTLVLVLLVPYWAHRPKYSFFRSYLTYRLNLRLAVDLLDSDPAWQHFKESNSAADSIPLARIPAQVPFVTGQSSTPAEPEPKRRTLPGRPTAPTGLTATINVELRDVPQIVKPSVPI